jgi:hypothetical protein
VNRSCFLTDAACRTPSSPSDMRFPLCVGDMRDCTVFSSVCALPSPTSAEGCPSLFGRFTGTTAQSDFSCTFTSALWFMAFTDRSCSNGQEMRIPTKEIGDSDLMPIMIGAQRSWAVSC